MKKTTPQYKKLFTAFAFFSLVIATVLFANQTFAEEIVENNPETQSSLEIVSDDNSQSSIVSPAAVSESEATKAPNEALQVLRDKQTQIQEAFEASDLEKKTEVAETELETVQLEKKTLEDINLEIKSEVEKLQSEIAEQQILQSSLQLAEQKNIENEQKLQSLESSSSQLQKELETKNLLLERNLQDIETLEQQESLKEYALQQNVMLQQALQEKSQEESSKKIEIFSFISLTFLVLYIFRFIVEKKFCNSKKHKKLYRHKFVAFDILIFFSYLGFTVWFLFYLKPEMVVYLLFLVGAIVIVLQEYIFSVISSVFIVQGYHVGSRIRFNGKEGIIEGMNLLKVSVRSIDSMGINMEEVRMIPNSQFMKQEVAILSLENSEKTSFKIVLPSDLSINVSKFLTHIEETVLQKNITCKTFNEITDKEKFYETDFSFMKTGQPVIEVTWKETREKSNRIKRKILAELEFFKQNRSYIKNTSTDINDEL